MKSNKVHIFALGIALTLCTLNLWAQQPVQQQVVPPSSPPKTAPKTPPPPHRSSAASASSADSASADANTTPEWVIYEFYLGHVTHLEEAADQEEKAWKEKGKNVDENTVSPWRTHEQRVLGLTDDEAKILRELALDCKSALNAEDQKMMAFRDDYHSQHPDRFADLRFAPEFVQLGEERTQIIKDHLQQLKFSLGDATFQKLDDYVKSEFAPDIKEVSPSTSVPGAVQVAPGGGAR
ncbi:MAG TPA: hypothetical protein VK699_02975 [Terriglobales bacterium]|jgi:hypothetical protein|nr:hypothetical protein [Terriglobales bacterium]